VEIACAIGWGSHGIVFMTRTVEAWESFGRAVMPLPHPSPRNNIWLRPRHVGITLTWSEVFMEQFKESGPEARVLIIDVDPAKLNLLTVGLSGHCFIADAFSDTSQGLLQLEPARYLAIVADQRLNSALCGHEFLLVPQQVDPEVMTILLSAEDIGEGADPERFDAVLHKLCDGGPNTVLASKLAELIVNLRSSLAA
jgi:hypothetical protein